MMSVRRRQSKTVKRRAPWLGRLVVFALGVALLASVFCNALPMLLDIALRRVLAEQGLDGSYATVRHVGWDELVLAPVHLGIVGGEPLRAERVTVRFTLGELLRNRRVTHVDVHGLRVPLAWRDGRWMMPTVTRQGPPAAPDLAAAGAGAAALLAHCPIITLHRATVVLAYPQGMTLLPVSGQLVATDDGDVRASLAWHTLDAAGRLTASGNLRQGDLEVALEHGQLNLAHALALLEATGRTIPRQAVQAAQGTASIAARGHWHAWDFAGASGTVRLDGGALPFVESLDLAWQMTGVEELAMTATGSATLDASRLAAAWASGRLTGAALDVQFAGTLTRNTRGEWRYEATAGLAERPVSGETDVGHALSATLEAQITARGDMQRADAEFAGVLADAALQHADSTVKLDALRLHAALTVDLAAMPPTLSIVGEATAEGMSAEHGPDIALTGASATLPFHWLSGRGLAATSDTDGEDRGGGRFRFAALRAAGFTLSCTDGTVDVDWPRLRFGGTLALADAPLSAQVVATLESFERPRGRLSLKLLPITVEATDTWYRRWHPALSDLALSGTFAGEAEFRLLPTGLRARGVLQASDARLATAHGGETGPSVSGVSGRIAFSDLLGWRTEPGQILRFEAARLGTLASAGGSVTFRLESAQRLFIEDSAIALLGGTISTPAARIDLGEPRLDAVLHLDRVQLAYVLKLIPNLDSAGSGTFFGKLPVTLRGRSISYGQGYLYSVPGVMGTLQVKDAGLLTAGLPASTPNFVSLKAAENALRDFRYSVMKLDFSPAGTGDTRVRLSIVGEPAGARPGNTVTLDINVRGALEETIALGIQLGRGLGSE